MKEIEKHTLPFVENVLETASKVLELLKLIVQDTKAKGVRRMTEMNKVRTMESAYEEIVSMDPNTAITKWAIRTAVVEGYVPSRRVGKKYLVNMKNIIEYFGGDL